jgi:hypothetical protein
VTGIVPTHYVIQSHTKVQWQNPTIFCVQAVPASAVVQAASNINMLSRISTFIFVLSSCPLWGQNSYTNKAEEVTIDRVKTLLVSSLDRELPRVTLEFFLKYEGEGAPIKWQTSNCNRPKGNPITDRDRDPIACVEADVHLKEGRSARVVVSLGRVGRHPADAATVFSVMVTDQNGATHDVRRLSDLPAELHRPLPKSPRDLPLPAGAS